ncbi:pyrroline-5-carboxylate reductase [Dehalococcoidia bacterium]|nr:pyrroline-5-carboxylate reductase [Dehalococcoidia bacterium]
MKIGFVGGGIMAEAMLNGILNQRIAEPLDVCIGEPVEARRQDLEKRYGIKTTQYNQEATAYGDLLILSIKPQNLPSVLTELTGSIRKEQVVLSIIAGATLETISTGLSHRAIIRVMPNTPAQIGAGMSVWVAAAEVDESFRNTTRSILDTLGEELEVYQEQYLDMATALSASGPAYTFIFLESLIDAGVYLGMPRDMAQSLAIQTVLGSTKLTQESGRHPAELRDMVTSPGGTTAEALKILEEGGFRATLLNAVVAAYQKAKRLGAR